MSAQRRGRVAAAVDQLHPLGDRLVPSRGEEAVATWRLFRACVIALATMSLLYAFDARGESDRVRDSLPAGALTVNARYASVDPDGTASINSPRATRSLARSAFPGLNSANILVRPHARTDCLPDELKAVLQDVAARFGPITVNSTHRGHARNRRVGGVPHSLHLGCRAVDFWAHGPANGIVAYLRARPEVGGLKRYRNGVIHIDNGTPRTW
jgi:uncharacterized protein YcbK (DUF882 family)